MVLVKIFERRGAIQAENQTMYTVGSLSPNQISAWPANEPIERFWLATTTFGRVSDNITSIGLRYLPSDTWLAITPLKRGEYTYLVRKNFFNIHQRQRRQTNSSLIPKLNSFTRPTNK